MNRRCPRCRALLGPHEGPRCVSCYKAPPEENSDIIIAVLEQADGPLRRWDIEREARGRYGLDVWTSYLLYDGRVCWAGRGLYGLYRRGYLPGARTLGAAASFYVHAAGEGISSDRLYFVMRRVGYRFSRNSLRHVLPNWVINDPWNGLILPRETKKVRAEMRKELRLSNRLSFTDVMRRTRRQIEEHSAEFHARLKAERTNERGNSSN